MLERLSTKSWELQSRLDVDKLLGQLVRFSAGERTAFRVVHVPSEADEHRRHLHRELRALITDRSRVMNRIGGLLATQGVRVKVRMDVRAQLPALWQWNGEALPTTFQSRLVREWEKVGLYSMQITALERERAELFRHSSDPAIARVRQLLELRGLGEASAWLFVMELPTGIRHRPPDGQRHAARVRAHGCHRSKQETGADR